MTYTLGSLFDGSGGFPLAGSLCGIVPKWAAQGHPPTVICKTYDARGNGDGETVNTLTGDHNNRITDYTSVIVENAPIYCLDGDKLGKAERAGGSGLGIRPGDTMYTLTAKDCHSVVYACSSKQQSLVTSENQANTLGANDYKEPQAVAYAMQAFGLYKESEVASSLKQRDYKDATDLVCGVDCRNLTEHPELYPTLQAKSTGGHSLNYSGACRIEYIVRRMTLTECARLQGFADCWGEIAQKDSFTLEEFQFWLDVRNTHAVINGREAKEYTKTQMLNWYNKLHTDSAEYKMWGNGIALPPALYCMQGITYALEGVSDEWML